MDSPAYWHHESAIVDEGSKFGSFERYRVFTLVRVKRSLVVLDLSSKLNTKEFLFLSNAESKDEKLVV